MNHLYFDREEFTGKDYTQNPLEKGVYENCNLSMAKLSNTSLKDSLFKNSKLMGLHLKISF